MCLFPSESSEARNRDKTRSVRPYLEFSPCFSFCCRKQTDKARKGLTQSLTARWPQDHRQLYEDLLHRQQDKPVVWNDLLTCGHQSAEHRREGLLVKTGFNF